MRLVVHCGLHKTASTHLQHLMDLNREALASRGVFYQHQPDFRAHHRAGWRLLAGDATLLDQLLDEAAERGLHEVILSSEDLEAAIFAPHVTALVDASAARHGAVVEWHMVLREPGETFASLHAQLPWHVYADTLWMFAEVMNKGGLYMHDPAPNWGGTPYWFYCFDPLRHLGAFASTSGHTPFVHDYADIGPYPGWRLLDRLGVLHNAVSRPDAGGQNRRHDRELVRANLHDRIRDAGGGALDGHVAAAVDAALAAVPDCARLVGERFAASYRGAVERFGRW